MHDLVGKGQAIELNALPCVYNVAPYLLKPEN